MEYENPHTEFPSLIKVIKVRELRGDLVLRRRYVVGLLVEIEFIAVLRRPTAPEAAVCTHSTRGLHKSEGYAAILHALHTVTHIHKNS